MLFVAFVLFFAFVALRLGLVTMQFNGSVSFGQYNGSTSVDVTGEGGAIANVTCAAAVVGSLTTRTSDTAGELTMSAGHGLTTGQRVDLFWTDGHCYGAILGTVSGNTVPIASVEGGDALPLTVGTSITVGPTNYATFNVVGNNMQSILIVSPGAYGYAVLHDGTDDHLAVYVGPGANSYSWRTGVGTNPIAGDTVTRVYFSTTSPTGTTDMAAAAVIA